jgi:hypothetical protein
VELVRRRHPVLLLLPSLLTNVLAAVARTDPAVRTASGPRPPRAQALSSHAVSDRRLRYVAIDDAVTALLLLATKFVLYISPGSIIVLDDRRR